MFIKINKVKLVFSIVLFLICFFTNNVYAKDKNVVSNHNKPELLEIGSGQVQILNSKVNSEDIIINQEHSIQNLEIKPQKIESKSTNTEPTVLIKKQKQEKYKRENSIKGVSIAHAGGRITPALIKHTKQENMKRIENLGKPQGQKINAQSVKSVVKYADSEKLKKLEENRLKRKASFKNKLEKREARKHLIDRSKE